MANLKTRNGSGFQGHTLKLCRAGMETSVCPMAPNLAFTGTVSLNSVMVPMPSWNLRSSGTVSLQEDSSQ